MTSMEIKHRITEDAETEPINEPPADVNDGINGNKTKL